MCARNTHPAMTNREKISKREMWCRNRIAHGTMRTAHAKNAALWTKNGHVATNTLEPIRNVAKTCLPWHANRAATTKCEK